MPLSCDFTFDKSTELYRAGETVKGTVDVSVTTPTSIKSITIKLQGETSVSFNDFTYGSHNDCDSDTSHDSDDCPEKDATEFSSYELFVDKKKNVSKSCTLTPGEYTYDFDFTLPDDCPNSFESEVGSIKYCILVVIRDAKNKSHEFAYDIDVEGIYDLNEDPNNKKPVQVQHVKSFSWYTLTSGKISFVLNIPHGAYTPLQVLPYTLLVNNESEAPVKGYKLELKQTVVYTANDPSESTFTEVTNTVEEEYDDECPPHCKREFEYDFEVPPTVPSLVENEFIDISYSFVITVNISGLNTNVEISTPLEIGTVPISESLEDEASPSTSATAALEQAPPPSYQECQPPSFAEATGNNMYPSLEAIMLTASAPPLDLLENEPIGFRRLH